MFEVSAQYAMDSNEEGWGLWSSDGVPLPLAGVAVRGELLGLAARIAVSQVRYYLFDNVAFVLSSQMFAFDVELCSSARVEFERRLFAHQCTFS